MDHQRSGRRRRGKEEEGEEGEEEKVAQALLELSKGPHLLPLPKWAASRKRSFSATATASATPPSTSSCPSSSPQKATAAVLEPELPAKLFGVLPLMSATNDGKALGHLGVIPKMEDKRAKGKIWHSPTSPLSRSRSSTSHDADAASASASAEAKAMNEAQVHSAAATVPKFVPLQPFQVSVAGLMRSSCENRKVGTRDTAGNCKGKDDRKRKLTIMVEELSVENEELRQQITLEQQRREKLKALQISVIQRISQKKLKLERAEKLPDLNLPPIPELEME